MRKKSSSMNFLNFHVASRAGDSYNENYSIHSVQYNVMFIVWAVVASSSIDASQCTCMVYLIQLKYVITSFGMPIQLRRIWSHRNQVFFSVLFEYRTEMFTRSILFLSSFL